MLSSCVVKRWFWLYFSNLCQAVWPFIRSIHSLIVCSICTAFITGSTRSFFILFLLYFFVHCTLCILYFITTAALCVLINGWMDGYFLTPKFANETNDVTWWLIFGLSPNLGLDQRRTKPNKQCGRWVRPTRYAPSLRSLLWPWPTFDRLTLKLACESHLRWGTFLPNLGTLDLCVMELFTMYATDGLTDGRT